MAVPDTCCSFWKPRVHSQTPDWPTGRRWRGLWESEAAELMIGAQTQGLLEREGWHSQIQPTAAKKKLVALWFSVCVHFRERKWMLMCVCVCVCVPVPLPALSWLLYFTMAPRQDVDEELTDSTLILQHRISRRLSAHHCHAMICRFFD